MAVKLKDLLAGQQRLAQQGQEPERISPEQLAELTGAVTNKPTEANLQANNNIFAEFVKQTQKREELLKDATKEQSRIFKQLETTILKLRDAGRSDSIALRRSIDKLASKLGATPATRAKEGILKAIAPATVAAGRTGPSAAPLSPEGYQLYESAGTVGSENEPVLGEAEPKQDQDESLGLGDLLKIGLGGLLGRKLFKGGPAAAKAMAKGKGPVTGAVKSSASSVGGFKKDDQGRWRNAKGQYVKKPSLMARAADKVKAPFKAIGKVASKIPFIAPLVTAGLAAADEYEQSGNLFKAATVGTTSAIAGEIGAAAGFAAAGPIGAFAGGVLGAEAGKKAGGFAYDAVTTPALKENTSAKIREMTLQNQNILEANRAEPQVIVTPPSIMPQPQTISQMHAPRGDIRPTESALERHIFRGYMV